MNLAAVIPYFNWTASYEKRANLQRFLSQESLVGVLVFVVECALFGESFELVPGPQVIQVRARSALWQKESLLNVALRRLPREIDAIAWVDGDVLFGNRYWTREAARLLENSNVLQLFSSYCYLPKGRLTASPKELPKSSFMAGMRDHSDPSTPAILGHPGFAWAARRDVLEKIGGFYERSVIGGADRLMAHAWFGDFHADPVKAVARGAIFEDYLHWAKNAWSVVQGNVGLVRGNLLHLWHGSIEDRQYYTRHIRFDEFGFDPNVDLTHNAYGCVEWASEKEEMHSWVANYFPSRREP